MSTTITSECINCGACEPECPNTAIYAGGVEWELNGKISPAIAQDIFYIVPDKCTECVGFHDHEACAAVCPVDCCVPDPANPETEAVLLTRARALHPELNLADDAPSRFRKEGGAPVPAQASASAENASAPAAVKPAAVPPPAAPAPKPAASPAAPKAPATPVVVAPIAMVNLPKDIGALPGPLAEKHFAGELDEDLDTVLGWVDTTQVRTAPLAVKVALRLAEPLLGALPDGVKTALEDAMGSTAAFSRARSTALNMILNLILYPSIFVAISVLLIGDPLFSLHTRGWILLGVVLAAGESAWRLREGIFGAKPASELVYRGCWYGLALAPFGSLFARGGGRRRIERKVAFDGFETNIHDEKLERDRRYGTVYTVRDYANAYLIRLEMPRKMPASSLKRIWNLPDEMPDYDYSLALGDSVLTINASVRGEAIRRLSYVSSAFPADFQTRIEFDAPVSTFRHRMKNKVLDVIVIKGEGDQARNAA